MKPILVTGASGKLGAYVVKELVQQGRPVVAWSGTSRGRVVGVPLRPVNLEDPKALKEAFLESGAERVIHCAAVSAISDVLKDEERALRINRDATEALGHLSDRIVYTSTDLVFDGTRAPYSADAPPTPVSKYGASKVAGEQALASHPSACVVRVSLMYGPNLFQPAGFFEHQVEALRSKQTLRLFHDEWRTPLAYDEAALGLIKVLDSNQAGILHLGGSERLSRLEMGQQLAQALGVEDPALEPLSQSDIAFPEPRPSDVSLDSQRTYQLLDFRPDSYRAGLKRLL